MPKIVKFQGNYNTYQWSNSRVKEKLQTNPPTLFICGHSHILKVMNDKKLGILYMNPGAAGNSGLHKVQTMLRFKIDGKNISGLEVVELERGYN